jgi:hypothetical protein
LNHEGHEEGNGFIFMFSLIDLCVLSEAGGKKVIIGGFVVKKYVLDEHKI